MSPRAAWRLESLGFSQVFDYAAGEADWFASGLPREGREASVPRVADIVRRDIPTCRVDDRVGDVRDRVRAAGWDTCVVVNREQVVLGRLRSQELVADAERRVEEAMEAGPTTVRPNVRLSELAGRMGAEDISSFLVTTSDGRLVGLVDRATTERALRG